MRKYEDTRNFGFKESTPCFKGMFPKLYLTVTEIIILSLKSLGQF